MSSANTKSKLGTRTNLSEEATRDISAALSALLADVFALYLKTKNFHWHMSGPHFRDYHLLLDEQGEQIFAMTDPMAERARKIGGTTLRSIGQIAKLQQEEQIATYRKTVFSAFQAVETTVGTADAITQQIDFIEQQVHASVEAERISELQYREGTIDITTLINTQSTLFSAQISLVNTKLARLQNSINLYIALGGGWDQKTADADYKPSLDWFPL